MAGVFAVAFLIFAALSLVLISPVIVLAYMKGTPKTAYRFMGAGAAISLMCAAVVTGSDEVVGQCRSAGNPPYNCIDYGGTGLLLLLVGGLAVTSIARAVYLFRG